MQDWLGIDLRSAAVLKIPVGDVTGDAITLT